MKKRDSNLVYQFKITLLEIEPTIWRRIIVPEDYSFWDLHVAISDSMGWLDYHLHQFLLNPHGADKRIEIGLPGDFNEQNVLNCFTTMLRKFFKGPGDAALYVYDFGDDWKHEVLLEAIMLCDDKLAYPVCLAGERACPPEDCGGTPGYYEMLKILKNPRNKEHKEMVAWVQSQSPDNTPYRPDFFDPNAVHFDDPSKRWETAHSG